MGRAHQVLADSEAQPPAPLLTLTLTTSELLGSGCIPPTLAPIESPFLERLRLPLVWQRQVSSELKVNVSESQDHRLYTHSNLLL